MNSGLSNSVLSLGPWQLCLTDPFWNQNRPLGFRNFFPCQTWACDSWNQGFHGLRGGLAAGPLWTPSLWSSNCHEMAHHLHIISPGVLWIVSTLFITTNIKHRSWKWLSHILCGEWWQEKLTTCLVCFFPLSVFKLRLVRPMGTKFHRVWGASCN